LHLYKLTLNIKEYFLNKFKTKQVIQSQNKQEFQEGGVKGIEGGGGTLGFGMQKIPQSYLFYLIFFVVV